MSHVPRLRYAIFILLIGLAAFLAGGFLTGLPMVACLIAGGLLWFLSICEAAWIGEEIANTRRRLEIERIQAVTACPNEKLNALSVSVPEINLRWIHGAIVPTWEDTGVPLEVFRTFMADAREESVKPVREWAKDSESQRQYEIIIQKLLELGFLKTEPPRGPYSWRWRGNMRVRAWERWMTWDVTISGLQDMDGEA